MNKLDSQPQRPTLAIDPASQPEASTLRHRFNTPLGRSALAQNDASLSTSPDPARRLIVLIPADSDYTAATRQIWELAVAGSMRVLFLGLCKDPAQEPTLRRGLVTISALIQDARVSAEAKVEIGTNWVNTVKRNYQAGDMIVCFAEQHAGLLHRPLSQILESDLKVPVYILSGLHPQAYSISNWFSQAAAWTGSVGVIAGMFLLQSRMVLMPKDWAQTTLLIFSVIFETWLIWVWNSMF